MPDVNIGGTKLPNVHSVTVTIGLSHGEATRLPDCTATFEIPTDEQTLIHDWLLAPQGPDRFKKVEITTYDRSKKTNKTWTFAKAYVAHMAEGEFAGDGEQMTTVSIMGTLIHAKADYDGTNILQVAPGEVEVVAS